MADLDRLFDEFVAEHRSGRDPDPRRLLEGLDGAERAELAALIDAYLARAPRRAWDPDAFADSPAREVADAVARSLAGAGGAWPAVLPRLRRRAKLRRDELVNRLAEALGAPGRAEKVGFYYHRMEQGSLPAAGVSERVLEAIGEIVGAGAGALRRAGGAIDPPAPTESQEAVFARLARGDLPAEGASPPEDAERAAAVPPDAERDEIDELFTGG